MPKFKSVSVAKEVRGKDGNVTRSGDVVHVPMDEAAFLEPACEAALNAGLILKADGTAYTREEFKVEQDRIRKMFAEREALANKRRAVL